MIGNNDFISLELLLHTLKIKSSTAKSELHYNFVLLNRNELIKKIKLPRMF